MRRLILAFAVVAPLLLAVLWIRGMPLAGIAVLALSHALILIPTLLPNVQWLGPVVTHFRAEAKEVWLTIDDGPAEDTSALLDALDARGVKASFFLKGELSAAHPERVAAIGQARSGVSDPARSRRRSTAAPRSFHRRRGSARRSG